MRLMGLMGRMGFIGLVCLIGFMGCSKDAVEELGGAEGEGMPVEVKGYVADFDENQLVTRSWTPASPYQLYGESDKSIGIAFTQNDVGPLKGHFFKSSGKWRTNIKDGDIKALQTYYLYGYVPHLSGMGFEISGSNAGYSDGAKITLNNVPAIMPSDLCVTIGAKHGSNAETPAGLRAGDFAYVGGSTTTENYVFLLFEHLYASLRVQMRVHGDYNALRTIKLKSLRLKTQAGETTSSTRTNIDIDLKATDGSNPSESPIQSIAYTPAGETISEAPTFWSSTAGETLTTAYTAHSAYFMPQDITTFVLTSVYDVYDTQGNLLRKDCMVTNTMQLSDLLTEQKKTRRGSRYTIKMTIKPTYLYMLSEPDLDSPTVTVE